MIRYLQGADMKIPLNRRPKKEETRQEAHPETAAAKIQSTDSPLPEGTVEHSPAQIPPWALGLLLVLSIFVAYQQAWNAGFIWDDDLYVTKNELLTAPDGLKRIWFSRDSPSQYFPLVYTTFRWERKLWGLDAAGYHGVNILLHSANTLLLWGLLRRLQIPGAWLAAGLFALHPVQVESVAWIAERKNVLSLFFSLLTAWMWVECILRGPRTTGRYYGAALLFYALALFSKTTACTLPAALLLILWLKRIPIDWRWLARVVPFAVMGVAMGLLTVWWEHHHQGVAGKFVGIGMLERLLIASRAIWFYAGKLLWPASLAFNYPLWTINPSDPLAYGWLVALAGLAVVVFFARRRLGRSVEVALLFYVASLAPLLGFFMLSTFRYTFVADHYQYVASIGPLTLAAVAITQAISFLQKRSLMIAPALVGIFLGALGILTWCQTGTYRNLETLWRATVEENPKSFLGHHNLGMLLLANGHVDEAIAHLQTARQIQPDAELITYNLGNAFLAKGEADTAIGYYKEALAQKPDGAAIAYALGNALFAKGQGDEAIEYYRKAFEIQPDGAAIANTLGGALLARGRIDEAIGYFRKASELAPGLARAQSNLGDAFVRKGELKTAIGHYEAALKIQSTNVIVLANLAWLLSTSPETEIRDGPRAVALAQTADRLSGGGSPQVLQILAAAYAETGKFPEAIATAQRALALPVTQANASFASKLQNQLKLFQEHSAVRDPGLTNIAPARLQP